MGLDFAYVMIKIEEKFGITITSDDFDWSKKSTLVKDLYDIVERNTCRLATSVLESRNFHEKVFDNIKQAFAEGLGIYEIAHWTMETTLRQLHEQIPEVERRKKWKRFRKQPDTQSQKRIKSIVESKYPQHWFIAWCGYIVFVFVIPACLGQYFWLLGLVVPLFFFIPGSILWLCLWNWWSQILRNASPPDVILGEIVEQVILQHQKSLKEDGSPYTRTEIEEIVKSILCEELGIKPEIITPEKDLIRDLGMG